MLREVERRWIASQPVDFRANLRMVDEMYRYARKLGKFPGPDLMEPQRRLPPTFRYSSIAPSNPPT